MALNAPWLKLPHVAKLFAILGEKELRFVGGAVRDSLLGKDVHELDAATTHTPDKIIQLLQAAGIKVVPTGIDHGTITAVFGKETVEITTLRSDAACDGRHAEVTYTHDWQADAARRDFTINAMYVDAGGTLTDYFGGEADLKNKRLRFIGDASARIEEDYLRILRFFRFSAQLSFAITADDDALPAIRSHVNGIQNLSGERIQQEMFKLLGAPTLSSTVLHLMHEAKVLDAVGLSGEVPLEALQKAEAWLALPPNALRRLSLWKTDVQTRWKLSNAAASALQTLTTTRLNSKEKSAKQGLRKLGKEMFLECVALHFSHGTFTEAEVKKVGDLANNWPIPTFPLQGKDLIAQGFPQGKLLGDTLAHLEKIWEESDYSLSKEALLKQLPRQ